MIFVLLRKRTKKRLLNIHVNMIYLKPLGGLCNRMRTLDSWISLCAIYKKDLTVLWVKDNSLNSSFEELFEMPETKEFKLNIVDCPTGFPENFLYKGVFGGVNFGGFITNINDLKRIFKNLITGRLLSTEHKKIRNNVNILDNEAILTDSILTKIYASDEKINISTTSEMDEIFFTKVETLVESILKKENSYISSCYRICPTVNRYNYFVPVKDIQSKINSTIINFKDTYGLHIRKSDHRTSKKFSTTDKFVKVINDLLENNPDSTFFLSTDDEFTKDNLINEYIGKIFYNKIESYDRNNSNAVKDALVDLYCLSKTIKVHGSHHSSFSQTAADIGQIEEITVK
ncbi:hypothetical protein [Maribacter litoralis]|uniref:hypothetical protein n=1 Tax=Maribacter litoralis TaxID=2059726 RepID=UPI003F5CF88E